MRLTLLRTWLCPLILFAGILFTNAGAADKDDGFADLFNGKDFTGWKFELSGKDADATKTWSVKDGVIICTGKPNGYFYTDKRFKNYVIRYDWKYVKPPEGEKSTYNSGLLLHIQPPQKVFPKCVEVQGANANHGTLYFVGFDKADREKTQSKYDKEAKDKATKPIGEWNTTEAICNADGSIVAKINGSEVSSGKSELTQGNIGFQSEGAEIHFRNIKIKEVK